MNSTNNNGPRLRRVYAEGDRGQAVSRVAKIHDARAAVWQGENMLELVVSPYGVWNLNARAVAARGRTVAEGTIDEDGRVTVTRADDEPHQGFTNYETFCFGEMIDNDRRLLDRWHRAARAALAESTGTPRTAAGLLADTMKRWFVRRCPDDLPSPFGSLLWAAFAEVDWYDLAEHMLADLAETDKGAA